MEILFFMFVSTSLIIVYCLFKIITKYLGSKSKNSFLEIKFNVNDPGYKINSNVLVPDSKAKKIKFNVKDPGYKVFRYVNFVILFCSIPLVFMACLGYSQSAVPPITTIFLIIMMLYLVRNISRKIFLRYPVISEITFLKKIFLILSIWFFSYIIFYLIFFTWLNAVS